MTTANDIVQTVGSTILSLRDAIVQANQATGPVTIEFDPNVFSKELTITLAKGGFELSNTKSPITIIGPGNNVIINGGGQSGIFMVDAKVNATFSRLVITGGNNATSGAIENDGTLAISDCVIGNNSAPGSFVMGTQFYFTLPGEGGGVSNAGTLKLFDCAFSQNSATGGPNGSIGSGDTGQSTGAGGALYNSGTASIIGCTFAYNSTDGNGGAIANVGTLSVINSTFAANSANVGGAIDSPPFTLVNCTISLNSANTGGGGIDWESGAGAGSIANTVLAGNAAPGSPDVLGHVTSAGFNLIGKTNGGTGWNTRDLTGTLAHPLDAKLGPLTNNGGPTQTLLLLPGSPAINHGSNALIPKGITTDQRGVLRIVDGIVDIGAVED